MRPAPESWSGSGSESEPGPGPGPVPVITACAQYFTLSLCRAVTQTCPRFYQLSSYYPCVFVCVCLCLCVCVTANKCVVRARPARLSSLDFFALLPPVQCLLLQLQLQLLPHNSLTNDSLFIHNIQLHSHSLALALTPTHSHTVAMGPSGIVIRCSPF